MLGLSKHGNRAPLRAAPDAILRQAQDEGGVAKFLPHLDKPPRPTAPEPMLCWHGMIGPGINRRFAGMARTGICQARVWTQSNGVQTLIAP